MSSRAGCGRDRGSVPVAHPRIGPSAVLVYHQFKHWMLLPRPEIEAQARNFTLGLGLVGKAALVLVPSPQRPNGPHCTQLWRSLNVTSIQTSVLMCEPAPDDM